jgi:hypothetical protein
MNLNTNEAEKLSLRQYLGGMLAATTADELEAAIQAPHLHPFSGPTWSRISKVRDQRGKEICEAHSLGKFVPRVDGRTITVCGETYRVARGGNSTGVRYAWHSVGEFVQSILLRDGFTKRAAYRIWDNCGRYPHRCLAIVESALKAKYPDPQLNRLVFAYRSSAGPIRYTVAQNEADSVDGRASRPCGCGGTRFDWGCGFSDSFTYISWPCNACNAVYIEYVTPDRLEEIRQQCRGVPSAKTRRSGRAATTRKI